MQLHNVLAATPVTMVLAPHSPLIDVTVSVIAVMAATNETVSVSNMLALASVITSFNFLT